jgi:hypothetical protein
MEKFVSVSIYTVTSDCQSLFQLPARSAIVSTEIKETSSLVFSARRLLVSVPKKVFNEGNLAFILYIILRRLFFFFLFVYVYFYLSFIFVTLW